MMNLPANLPDLLRAAGLRVEVDPGWLGRGHFDFDPVGALNHHTGASAKFWSRAKRWAYARWMFRVGRSDLPGPICNISLGPDGTVYLGASRASYHGGTAKASGTVAAGSANSRYIGIEWMLSGTEKIPDAMMAAGITLNAVLTGRVTDGGKGTSSGTVSCHYQTSETGKWDIGDPEGVPFKGVRVLDVDEFRRDVTEERDRLYNRPKAPSRPPRTVTVGWATINAKPHWSNPGGRAVKMIRQADVAGATWIAWQEFTAAQAKAVNKMQGWKAVTAKPNDRLLRRGSVGNGIAFEESVWRQVGPTFSEPKVITYRKGTKRGGLRGPVRTKTVYACGVYLQHRKYGFIITAISDHVPTAYNAVGDTREKFVARQRERLLDIVGKGRLVMFGEDSNGTLPMVVGTSLQGKTPGHPDLGLSNGRRAKRARVLPFPKDDLSDHPGLVMFTRFTRAQLARVTPKKEQ